jgi:recombination protein RecT
MSDKMVTAPNGQMQRRTDAVGTIQQLLESNKAQLAAALPRHMDPARLIRVAVTSLRKNPSLLNCDRASLISCIFQAAQLGLEVDNGLGHAYLVPFKQECTLIVGFKGLVDLCRRSGQISTIKAVLVHKGDHFYYEEGLKPTLEHRPKPANHDSPIEYVYAVATLRDGGTQFEVMHVDEVRKIQAGSRAGKSGPWIQHFGEMAKKSVIRRLCKMLPVSVELARAVALDEQADAGIDQSFDVPTEEFSAMLASPSQTVEPSDAEVIREPGQEG